MIKENYGLKGKLSYELRDIDGNLIDEGKEINTITNFMDAHVADQMSGSAEAQIGFMAIGSGTGGTASSDNPITYTGDISVYSTNLKIVAYEL